MNCSRSKTTMRREWVVVRTRNVNQLDEIRENKKCRANALVCARDDYIFDCAMKNPPLNHKIKSTPLGVLFVLSVISRRGFEATTDGGGRR